MQNTYKVTHIIIIMMSFYLEFIMQGISHTSLLIKTAHARTIRYIQCLTWTEFTSTRDWKFKKQNEAHRLCKLPTIYDLQ